MEYSMAPIDSAYDSDLFRGIVLANNSEAEIVAKADHVLFLAQYCRGLLVRAKRVPGTSNYIERRASRGYHALEFDLESTGI